MAGKLHSSCHKSKKIPYFEHDFSIIQLKLLGKADEQMLSQEVQLYSDFKFEVKIFKRYINTFTSCGVVLITSKERNMSTDGFQSTLLRDRDTEEKSQGALDGRIVSSLLQKQVAYF